MEVNGAKNVLRVKGGNFSSTQCVIALLLDQRLNLKIGQLCSLVDIEELPQKAVLKVIQPESDDSSLASDDTIILPHAMIPDRVERWPAVFPVLTFSYEVVLILGEGNIAFERTGKTLWLSRGQKHEIVETHAAKMCSFKAYNFLGSKKHMSLSIHV